jgi:4-amino-4-deoxy-L-arabinose transferase-like glycosyltransferase
MTAASLSPRWLVVLLIMLGIKLTFAGFVFFDASRAFLPDAYGYADLANNLLARGQFDVPGEPALAAIRTPGYPAFIAGIYAILGRTPGWVILIQLVLDALTGGLIWQIGKQIFSDAVGWLGAFIYALSVNATAGALYLLSDTLFTFLLVAAFFGAMRFWQTHANRWLGLTGLVLGIATLTRPIGLYLALIWLGVAAIFVWQSAWQNWRGLVAMAAILSVLVAPWMFRTWTLTGRVAFSAAEAMNLYCCFAPAAVAQDTGVSLDQAKQQVNTIYPGSLNEITPPELFRLGDYAVGIIWQHPIGYIKAHLKGITATLFEPAYKQWAQTLGIAYTPSGFLSELVRLNVRGAWASLTENTSAGLLLLIPLFNIVYAIAEYILATLGALEIFRRARDQKTLALAVIGALTIVYIVAAPGPGGGLRFRIPAEPFLALFAASGMQWNNARINFK